MPDQPKPFKAPPKKYQPRGLIFLYEDRDILVVDKAPGLLTVSNEKVRDRTAYALLTDYVRKGNSKSRNRVFIVHRLDQETSGILVFAKTESAQQYLQDNWQDFKKTYFAVTHGGPKESEGIITSYLAESTAHKMYSVSDPKAGKLSKTGYKTLDVSKNFTLLELDLLTGRKNQIRVHLADMGCPVAGDKKYGRKDSGFKRLMLHAVSLSIRHPFSKKEMVFETKVPPSFGAMMKG